MVRFRAGSKTRGHYPEFAKSAEQIGTLPFSRPPARAAFTLVEMLVVIVIIAILAALITAAAASALWSAKQTKIKVELDQLAGAMEAFNQKYSGYPPANLSMLYDGTNYYANPQLTAFVAKAFPRYTVVTPGLTSIAYQIAYDLTSATGTVWLPTASAVGTPAINPQIALAFWLSGFTADPTDPFNRNGNAATPILLARTPLFAFDQTRLLDVTTGNPVTAPIAGVQVGTPYGHMIYNAPYGNAAYCYFDHNTYGTLNVPSLTPPPYMGQAAQPNTPTSPDPSRGIVYASTNPQQEDFNGALVTFTLSNGTGYVMPYVLDVNGSGTFNPGDTFCKPTSYQIISAGQDGSFGTANSPALNTAIGDDPSGDWLYPTGYNYDPPPPSGGSADDDNVTNFCEKSTLDAAKP